jgi:hypothetical protein
MPLYEVEVSFHLGGYSYQSQAVVVDVPDKKDGKPDEKAIKRLAVRIAQENALYGAHVELDDSLDHAWWHFDKVVKGIQKHVETSKPKPLFVSR